MNKMLWRCQGGRWCQTPAKSRRRRWACWSAAPQWSWPLASPLLGCEPINPDDESTFFSKFLRAFTLARMVAMVLQSFTFVDVFLLSKIISLILVSKKIPARSVLCFSREKSIVSSRCFSTLCYMDQTLIIRDNDPVFGSFQDSRFPLLASWTMSKTICWQNEGL